MQHSWAHASSISHVITPSITVTGTQRWPQTFSAVQVWDTYSSISSWHPHGWCLGFLNHLVLELNSRCCLQKTRI